MQRITTHQPPASTAFDSPPGFPCSQQTCGLRAAGYASILSVYSLRTGLALIPAVSTNGIIPSGSGSHGCPLQLHSTAMQPHAPTDMQSSAGDGGPMLKECSSRLYDTANPRQFSLPPPPPPAPLSSPSDDRPLLSLAQCYQSRAPGGSTWFWRVGPSAPAKPRVEHHAVARATCMGTQGCEMTPPSPVLKSQTHDGSVYPYTSSLGGGGWMECAGTHPSTPSMSWSFDRNPVLRYRLSPCTISLHPPAALPPINAPS